MLSIIVEKTELFISLEFAVEFLNATFGDINVGDKDTLGRFLTTYIPVNGLFSICTETTDDQNINPMYLKGLCKGEYFSDGRKAFRNVDTKNGLLNVPCIIKTCDFTDWKNSIHEQELQVEPYEKPITNKDLAKNAMIQVKELALFVEKTRFPIDEQCFFVFFEKAHKVLKESYLVGLEEAEDKEEALRQDYFFNDLVAAFGQKYAEMIEGSIDFAIWNIMGQVKEDKVILEEATKLLEAETVQSEVKKGGVKDSIYNEDDVPDLLYLAHSLFDEAWRNFPKDMNKPSKEQLSEILKIKGITEAASIDAIIKVSTPNNVVLGGKKRPGFIEWKPKNKRI